jgi:hypothetical protein
MVFSLWNGRYTHLILNPIEHIWHWLKKQIITDHPETLHWKGSHEVLRQRLGPLILEAWDQIPQEKFDTLWKSMKKRCEAIIEARG